LATLLTVLALPLLWSSKDKSSPGTQLAVTAASPQQPELNTPFEGTDQGPAFLASTQSTLPADVITIDVAAPQSGNYLHGKATYRNWPEGLANGESRPCGSPYVPFGSRIVVTNTDNGKKVACTNVTTRPLSGETSIIIDTATFVELADLTDAPLVVDLSW
jgi:hypothetical protein